MIRVFEVEIYAQLHDWASLILSVEEAIQFDPSAVLTFEAIADILYGEKECPAHVLYTALEVGHTSERSFIKLH